MLCWFTLGIPLLSMLIANYMHKLLRRLTNSEPALTIIVREADAQVDLLDLLHEQILLVEEKHNGSRREEPVVADAVEQMEGLVHAVLRTWGRRRRHTVSLSIRRVLVQCVDVIVAGEVVG